MKSVVTIFLCVAFAAFMSCNSNSNENSSSPGPADSARATDSAANAMKLMLDSARRDVKMTVDIAPAPDSTRK